MEFHAPGLVASGRPLPLAVLLHVLPGWRHARAAFVVGDGFAFAGPADETRLGPARAHLVGTGSSYEYDVEQGEQGTTTPARIIPPQTAAAQPAARTREATPPMTRIVLLIAAAAAVAAWIIFRPHTQPVRATRANTPMPVARQPLSAVGAYLTPSTRTPRLALPGAVGSYL